MRILYLVSVWLHIVSACAWIGGMLFLSLALVPLLRRPEFAKIAAPIVRAAGRRFWAIGWIVIATLIGTGIFNLAYRGATFRDVLSGRLFEGAYGRLVGAKLLTVIAILLVTFAHDLWIGPAASRRLAADPFAPDAQRWRRRASWVGRLSLLLALVAAGLGVLIVRGVG